MMSLGVRCFMPMLPSVKGVDRIEDGLPRRECAMSEERDSQKLLADLVWVWSSPSFLRDPAPGVTLLEQSFFDRHASEFAHLLEGLKRDPAPLEDFVATRPRLYKLGLYAQALLEFVLSSLPSIQLMACDLPVRRGEPPQTIGAFDFLFRDVLTGEVIHLEFAVKILLLREGIRGRETPRDWIGPEGRDRLDLKLAKLSDSQLRLGGEPEARTLLQERFQVTPQELKPRLLLRGMGFVPPGAPMQSQLIESRCLVGHWCRQGGVQGGRFLNSVPKRDWLAQTGEWSFEVHSTWPEPLPF